jgi:hypothetical protein
MLAIPAPHEDTLDVFRECVAKTKDRNLKIKLRLVENDIVDSTRQFVNLAANATLHTITPNEFVGGVITVDEMKSLYKNRFTKILARGETLYNRIKQAAWQGTCPLCAEREVTTLDHHLPQSLFPVLAVTPTNLVPACMNCNKIKSNKYPRLAVEQTLHPYFDNIENDLWLCVRLIENNSPAFEFYVSPPANWINNMDGRVRHHLKVFDLERLYVRLAIKEICSTKGFLRRLLNRAGATEVQGLLQEQAISFAEENLNWWKSALYRALAASPWFCNGGFNRFDTI